MHAQNRPASPARGRRSAVRKSAGKRPQNPARAQRGQRASARKPELPLRLDRAQLEDYVRVRFGARAQLESFGVIGETSDPGSVKSYGYGSPILLAVRDGKELRRFVLGTVRPGPFGHEHRADRAQAILWDYDSYGKLPRHVAAVDLGAFTATNAVVSLADTREFFVLTEWVEGSSYHLDLERLANTGRLRSLDRERAAGLAQYLAEIHRVKNPDLDLYRRRMRELIGHGECIMGLTDSYRVPYEFITADRLRKIEEAANGWRWRLRDAAGRLSQVHGDFHPWNILFRAGSDFSVLDSSRGEWGEPADDVTALTINYLFFSLRRFGRLRGPFEVLFREFWERYLEASGDSEITRTVAPFFAFRGLVLASPRWYPSLEVPVRRAIFAFVENVLCEGVFDPAQANRYCELN